MDLRTRKRLLAGICGLLTLAASCNQANVRPTPPSREVVLTPPATAVPTKTLKPPPAASPTPSPMSTPSLEELSALVGIWKTYANDEIGIQFEYPAVYDLAMIGPNRCFPSFSVAEEEEYLWRGSVGQRIWFRASEAAESDVEYYANQFLEASELKPAQEFYRQSGQIIIGEHGEQKLTVEYRFGIMQRWGVSTFVLHDGTLIEIDYNTGGGCDFPDLGVYEYDVYIHIVESLEPLD